MAEKSEYAVGLGIKVTLLAGLISSIIGLVMLMGHMDTPETIGPNLAVAMLTIFYAALLSLFLLVIKGKVHKLTEN